MATATLIDSYAAYLSRRAYWTRGDLAEPEQPVPPLLRLITHALCLAKLNRLYRVAIDLEDRGQRAAAEPVWRAAGVIERRMML